MSNIITFGKHDGKSFEWLFFNAPWYAQWMFKKGVHRNQYLFSEEEGNYYRELFDRASHITGTCPWCKERPFTRMSLSTHYKTGILDGISFYCDECEYTGSSLANYHTPSFFMEEYTLPRCEQLMITKRIKNFFIGRHERLTQSKMEEFFYEDKHFVDAETGFFANQQGITA